MIFKIYLPKNYNFFDGVKLYLSIIERAMSNLGYVVTYINDLSDIKREDVVLTISPYDFISVWIRKPYKIIHWVQGIAPEETLVNDKSFFNKYRRYLQYRFMESFILKKAAFILFVSQNMLMHYCRVYGYNSDNNVIMPCYNMGIDRTAFFDEKYQEQSFVYTGNLAGWQCFPETIDLFKKIKNKLPNANLTVFTKDIEDARKILNDKGVYAEVKYLPAERLAVELRKYKYGFLLRDDIEVNRVATPIKMNTYLSNGIIPIYSDVIGAFKDNLDILKHTVIVNNKNDISKIIELEDNDIKAEDVYVDFKNAFKQFYSDSYYIKKLSEKFKSVVVN